MTRNEQKLLKAKRIRTLAAWRVKNAKALRIQKFVRHLNKVVAEIPDVPQKDSIARTLDLIRVALSGEMHNG